MNAVASTSNNFQTDDYQAFKRHIAATVDNDCWLKSCSIFNRCVAQVTQNRDESGLAQFSADYSNIFMELPVDDRALLDFLRAGFDEQFPTTENSPPMQISEIARQMMHETLRLPLNSDMRQRVVRDIDAAIVQRRDARSFLEPLLQIQPDPNIDVIAAKLSILQLGFSLPFEEDLCRQALNSYREGHEDGIKRRLSDFLNECERRLAGDPLDLDPTASTIEHKATFTYAHRNRLDQLITCTYHKIFPLVRRG